MSHSHLPYHRVASSQEGWPSKAVRHTIRGRHLAATPRESKVLIGWVGHTACERKGHIGDSGSAAFRRKPMTVTHTEKIPSGRWTRDKGELMLPTLGNAAGDTLANIPGSRSGDAMHQSRVFPTAIGSHSVSSFKVERLQA